MRRDLIYTAIVMVAAIFVFMAGQIYIQRGEAPSVKGPVVSIWDGQDVGYIAGLNGATNGAGHGLLTVDRNDLQPGLFKVYGVGTTASAVVTQAASASLAHYVTWITGWSDTASLINLAVSGTVVWEGKILANSYIHATFPSPIFSAITQTVVATISTCTADCGVSFGGYSAAP